MKGIVRQVGYLLELYRDARSPEYKILQWESLSFSIFILAKWVHIVLKITFHAVRAFDVTYFLLLGIT